MPMLWSKYRRLKSEDSSEEPWQNGDGEASDRSDIERQKAPSNYSSVGIIHLLWKVAIAGLALYGTVDLTRRTFSHLGSDDGLNSCYCGNSVAEALSKGCIYDLLASAWLPEYCRDDELTAQFNQAGPGDGGAWGYFADGNGTIPIIPTAVGDMADADPGTLYYTTNEWHIVHCVYYWLKQYRSKDTGVVVEARYDNEGHIRHCGKMFLMYITEPYYVDTLQGAALDSSNQK